MMRLPKGAVLAATLAVASGLAQTGSAQTGTVTTPQAEAGQDATGAPVASPVLTLDQDRLFNGTLWGQRVAAAIEAASADLAAENRRIEGQLTVEEKSLTERRPTMNAEDFRKAADDFDSRVVGIRSAQDAKARALTNQRETEQQAFYTAILPLLPPFLRARGAVVILDNRAIFVSSGAIDVTDELIGEVDRQIGAGPEVPGQPPQPAPQPTPQPAPQPAPAPPESPQPSASQQP